MTTEKNYTAQPEQKAEINQTDIAQVNTVLQKLYKQIQGIELDIARLYSGIYRIDDIAKNLNELTAKVDDAIEEATHEIHSVQDAIEGFEIAEIVDDVLQSYGFNEAVVDIVKEIVADEFTEWFAETVLENLVITLED